MDRIELIVLMCTDCGGCFAIEAEYMRECEEVPECYYCNSPNTGTMVTNQQEVN